MSKVTFLVSADISQSRVGRGGRWGGMEGGSLTTSARGGKQDTAGDSYSWRASRVTDHILEESDNMVTLRVLLQLISQDKLIITIATRIGKALMVIVTAVTKDHWNLVQWHTLEKTQLHKFS